MKTTLYMEFQASQHYVVRTVSKNKPNLSFLLFLRQTCCILGYWDPISPCIVLYRNEPPHKVQFFKASKQTGNQFFQYIYLQGEEIFTEAGAKKNTDES